MNDEKPANSIFPGTPESEMFQRYMAVLDRLKKAEAELAAFKNIDKVLVDRFLSWRLPHDFAPDCGITFDGCKPDALGYAPSWPVGTNLLTADQARAMIKYIIHGEEGK